MAVPREPRDDRNRQIYNDGADAVPDTSYVAAHGAEPGGPTAGYKARVGSGAGGVGAVGWIVIALVALVALIYAIGFFR